MARKPRFSPGGLAYHVMNRTPGRVELFEDAGDYQAFEKVLIEAVDLHRGIRLCAYCLMPNHFHLVLWPTTDGQLSRFMQWLSMTHAARWHAHRHSVGCGHLYQGRFRSFPIPAGPSFPESLQICGTQCAAGQLGGQGAGLAVEFAVGQGRPQQSGRSVSGSLAGCAAREVGNGGESGGIGGGAGRVASGGCPRAAVRRRSLVTADGQGTGDGKLSAPHRQAEEAEVAEKRLIDGPVFGGAKR